MTACLLFEAYRPYHIYTCPEIIMHFDFPLHQESFCLLFEAHTKGQI